MRLKVLAIQASFFVALGTIWELGSRAKVLDPEILPPPLQIAAAMADLLQEAAFIQEAGITLLRVVVAFLIAAPISLLVGFVLGENRRFGDRLGGLFNVVLAVPQSIFLPIFILMLGLGTTQKIAYGITHVFFVVTITTMAAVRQVPAQWVQATRSFGGDRWRIYRSIYLPAMAPQVMTGLRLGLIFCIIGILLAEMYGSRDGVGLVIYRFGQAYQIVHLMASIFLISFITVAINETMRLWETRLGKWNLER